MPADSMIAVVDRIEGKTVVLESDDGRRFEVGRATLPAASEGLVFRVPLGAKGKPLWPTAVADAAETERRRRDLDRRMGALRKRDQGGDIEL